MASPSSRRDLALHFVFCCSVTRAAVRGGHSAHAVAAQALRTAGSSVLPPPPPPPPPPPLLVLVLLFVNPKP
jgi:hypothetical protein